ncbi:hypothetical protein BC835DRAFT_1382790 [Cytidiella melzeri]|nr:hypothetical protein BC835DRAFT_1382790 [Cytidiella melzeri]
MKNITPRLMRGEESLKLANDPRLPIHDSEKALEDYLNLLAIASSRRSDDSFLDAIALNPQAMPMTFFMGIYSKSRTSQFCDSSCHNHGFDRCTRKHTNKKQETTHHTRALQ